MKAKKISCKKCGASDLKIRFHTGETYYHYDGSVHKECGVEDFNQCQKEHIHKYCETCGYDWVEKSK